ncbi:hypothetical protein G6F31_019116 [Rhizopus arrhizus]|nr:hypothetical protein G6F31_019116 [Rhizopus arrhizus]
MPASSPDFDASFFRTALGRYATGLLQLRVAEPAADPLEPVARFILIGGVRAVRTLRGQRAERRADCAGAAFRHGQDA